MRLTAVHHALCLIPVLLIACGTVTEEEAASATDDSTPHSVDADSDSVGSDTDASSSRLTDPLRVRTVIDGDTIEVLRGEEVLRVRFKGIDTPELYTDGAPEAFAQEARDFVWDSVGNSQVQLQFDSDCGATPYETCRDGYDRLLAYVMTEEFDDLAEELLRNGLGNVYRFQNEVFDRLGTYQAAQASAQRDGSGIWSD
ncbi:MAG: thermonuclease family protein [Myxococcota bacterium]|nr:thermonuclease family protein [Myxococcota bacterium]